MSALTVLFCRNAQKFSACLSELQAGDSLVVLDGRKILDFSEEEMKIFAAEDPEGFKKFLENNPDVIKVIATRRKELSEGLPAVFGSFAHACRLAEDAGSIITVREPACQRTVAPTDFDLFTNPALIQ